MDATSSASSSSARIEDIIRLIALSDRVRFNQLLAKPLRGDHFPMARTRMALFREIRLAKDGRHLRRLL
jgi:hypothetical protein